MRITGLILGGILLVAGPVSADAKGGGARANNPNASASSRPSDSIPDKAKHRHRDQHKGPPVSSVCSSGKSRDCAATVSPA